MRRWPLRRRSSAEDPRPLLLPQRRRQQQVPLLSQIRTTSAPAKRNRCSGVRRSPRRSFLVAPSRNRKKENNRQKKCLPPFFRSFVPSDFFLAFFEPVFSLILLFREFGKCGNLRKTKSVCGGEGGIWRRATLCMCPLPSTFFFSFFFSPDHHSLFFVSSKKKITASSFVPHSFFLLLSVDSQNEKKTFL